MSVDAVQSKVADIADLDGDGKVDEKDLELAKAIAVERAEETKKMLDAGRVVGPLVRRLAGDVRIPAQSTVHAVLDRHGLVKRGRRRRSRAQGTPLSAALLIPVPALAEEARAVGSYAVVVESNSFNDLCEFFVLKRNTKCLVCLTICDVK
mgnify:CR=1 FL=1